MKRRLRGAVGRTIYSLPLFFLFLSPQARSQSPVLEVTHVLAPLSQLSISDVDFRHATSPKWLFTINIRTLDGSTVQVVMTMTVGYTLPNEPPYDDVVRFATDPFTVAGLRSVTNLDLDRSIALASYTTNRAALKRLEQIALPTGRLPAGSYNFSVQVTVFNGTSTAGTSFPIVVSNPTTVELLSPADGETSVGEFPLFQWRYDGPSSRISVYERLPGQASPEEATTGVPHYAQVVTTTSIRYPSGGARLLEPGKTYVWYVEGLSNIAGGTKQPLRSPLRSFTVGSGPAVLRLSAILDELADALPQYRHVFAQLRSQNFTTATAIRLNGRVISLGELRAEVRRLKQNPDAVTGVGVE